MSERATDRHARGGEGRGAGLPEAPFRPHAQILQDEPHPHVVVRTRQLERADAEAADQVPGEHAGRRGARIDHGGRHVARREQRSLIRPHGGWGVVVRGGDRGGGGGRVVIVGLGGHGGRRQMGGRIAGGRIRGWGVSRVRLIGAGVVHLRVDHQRMGVSRSHGHRCRRRVVRRWIGQRRRAGRGRRV